MERDLVPAVDAAGLPGPSWLFQFLLVLTFFLHMLFMNLALGGTLLAWVSHLRAGGRREGPHGRLAARMTAINGYGISLAITTGVAPLLFVQVLYQRYFYGGTILLGWIWFALIVLLLAGYYAVYLYKFRGAPGRGEGGGVWLTLSAVAFTVIAMIHVAAHLAHVQPGGWAALGERPWGVLADPTYVPRLVHFVLAGVAFSALVITWWAARRASLASDAEERESEAAIARVTWKWALWATVLQIVDGFALLFVLPRDVLLGVMRGGLGTLAPLALAILLGIGLIVVLARTVEPSRDRGLVASALGIVLAAVAVMSVTRHQVRVLYLEPFEASTVWAIEPQWGTFALFVVCLVLALGVVAFMTRRVLVSMATGDEAA